MEMDNKLKEILGLSKVSMVDSLENVDIRSEDIIIYEVSREAVERGHLETYLREFEKWGRKKLMSRVTILFNGYDHDPREVYNIPEIRKWVQRVLVNVPHFFYFMSPENRNIRIVYLCIAPIITGATFDAASAKPQVEKITKAATTYARKKGATGGEQFSLAESILNQLEYEKYG